MSSSSFKPTEAQRDDCAKYVANKASTKGGYREGWAGFRQRTLPYLLGLEHKSRASIILASGLKLIPLFLGAMLPVVARKIYPHPLPQQNAAPTGLEAIFKAIASIDITDLAFISAVVFITIFSKASEKYFKRTKPSPTNPHARMCEAIEALPIQEIATNRDSHNTTEALLKSCLAGIKHEISSLLLDDSGTTISDVVYWDFCDNQCKRMKVRSRLVADKPKRKGADSRNLQAFYVAKLGKVFAEHNFQDKSNPFPKDRAGVADIAEKSTYKSILFFPITTTEEHPDENGEPIERDYCVGVVCVASDRPFRFWRWGDHKTNEGTFGVIAYKQVTPYIALIRKLAKHSAFRVEVTA